MNDELTTEQLRKLAQEEPICLIQSGIPSLQHLALASQLHTHSQVLLAEAAEQDGGGPEHDELAAALRDAAKAAELAFDAAVNAAYQVYWVGENCKCLCCMTERVRENAANN